jgi:hypothetical protein
MKILGICGEPSTGKTSLMRKLMAELSVEWVHDRFKTLDYLHDERHVVLGKYAGEYFDGTDSLSMAVVVDAEAFLTTLSTDSVVLFEGDRLFCSRFLLACLRATKACRFVQLSYSSDTFLARRAERVKNGIVQAETFIKSRRTKYNNLRIAFPLIDVMMNNNLDDQKKIVNNLIEWINE